MSVGFDSFDFHKVLSHMCHYSSTKNSGEFQFAAFIGKDLSNFFFLAAVKIRTCANAPTEQLSIVVYLRFATYVQ